MIEPEIKLLNCDCREYMKTVPDKFFELAIVDPPFGIGNFWMKDKKTYHYGKNHTWNENIPSEEYFNELFRISKNQIIWGGNYYTKFLPATNAWLVWDKVVPKEVNFSQANLAWTSFKKSIRIYKRAWSGAICQNGNEKRDGFHPCEMPTSIYRWQLKEFAKPGDKIFDSHLGSGSIAIACHDMKFDLVGCEIDVDYYNAAVKRFEQHKKQLTIF